MLQDVLLKLERIQELDSKIQNLVRKKEEFPRQLEALKSEVQLHQQNYDGKKKLLDEVEKTKRQFTGALELNEERSKRSLTRMEAVKNSQEYSALQREVDGLKKSTATITENAKKSEEDFARLSKEAAEIEALLGAAKAKLEGELARINGETGGIDAEISKLQTQRSGEASNVEPRYLSTYDRLRIGRMGIGIVPAAGGNCRGCNMKLPPQMYNELQRGLEMFTCPSCKRILIHKDVTKTA